MTPRHRRPSARLLALSLSSLTVGALAVAGLSAGPAAAAETGSGSIIGAITAPANVPGTHRYVVQAWSMDGLPRDATLVASDDSELASGARGGYDITGLAPGSYVVRVVEQPADSAVPAVGDEFWRETDWVRASERVVVGETAVKGIDFTPSAYAFSSARIEGPDRYGTSVATTERFEPGLPVLYIASGEKWADALSAGPAATIKGGALLLTHPDALPTAVRDEIVRLAPKKTIVVGSDLTVTDAVYDQIDALVGEVTRIGGDDRYDTSRRIVADAFPAGAGDQVFLATGGNFPDALSAAPVAGRRGEAVLLVDGALDSLGTATEEAIARLAPSTAVVLGQTPSISAGIADELVDSDLVDSVERIGGDSRYVTSRLVNEAFPPAQLVDSTYLASGEGFADALSGATAAASQGRPISLSRPDCVPRETVDSLKRLHLDYAFVLGSERTLSQKVARVTAC